MVLYRKYRPKLFSEVVGQEHVVQTLTNALKEDILSHGYLFAGPHGVGKTTLARLLAKSLNCQNRQKGAAEPCNQCSSCQEISQGRAIDLIEIDAASNRGIDEIRELKEGIRFKPAKSKYKVFILDEAHQLSKDAANALLKTLEEPPSHAIFVLATTELHKMIPTIQSRCQTFTFRKLTLPELTARLETILKKEKTIFEKSALELIALSASGSIRDAESLLDETASFTGSQEKITEQTVRFLLGAAQKTSVLHFLKLLQEKKAKEAIDFLNNQAQEGIDLKEFTKSLIDNLRQILLLQIDSEIKTPLFLSSTKEEKQTLQALAQGLPPEELPAIIEKFAQAQNKMKYASILQLPLELAIVDICLKNQ